MRYVIASCVVAAALVLAPAIASAQGFGVGGRFEWVKADSDADVDAVRFMGGQVRLIGGRWGVELSMDQHSESFEALNQKITERPVQLSLLMQTGSSRLSPFLLAGRGWYKRTVKPLEGTDADVETTESGWHAGGGLEIRPGRRVGIHGDYRYTFLEFGDDEDDDDGGLISGLLPSHRGSMWTLGVTIYF